MKGCARGVALAGIAAAGIVAGAPGVARAEPPGSVAVYPGVEVAPERPRKVLIVGLSTFLGGYVPLLAGAIGVAGSPGADQRWVWGAIPVAGPWISLAAPKRRGVGDPAEGPATLAVDVLVGVLGVSQAVGTVALVAYAVPPVAVDGEAASSVQMRPFVGLGSVGVTGTF